MENKQIYVGLDSKHFLDAVINDRKIRIANVEVTPNPPGSVPFPSAPDWALKKKHKKSHWKLPKPVS